MKKLFYRQYLLATKGTAFEPWQVRRGNSHERRNRHFRRYNRIVAANSKPSGTPDEALLALDSRLRIYYV